MKHVLRLITVAVILLAVVIGFNEYKRSHTTRETYPGIEDFAEPERKVTLLPVAGEDETDNRTEEVIGGDKGVPNKNEGKTENKVTPQMLPTAAPTVAPTATPTAAPTVAPVEDEPVEEQPVAEKEPKATPHVLAMENQPGEQEGWGKIKASITASLTMKSLPQQGAGSVKRGDDSKNASVIISSDMPLKLYGLYEGEQEKIYRHVGVTYLGTEYYGYILADRIEEGMAVEEEIPTPTATVAPAPTDIPVWVPTSTPAPTPTTRPAAATPMPTATTRPVATSTPVPTATARPVATATPRPTATARPVATATPRPTATVRPAATSTPVPTPTSRPVATVTPMPTPTARPVATATPMPTPTSRPVATATPVPTPTARPVATATPMPTPTSRPVATVTPVPTATPIPTATPVPTATPAPVLERVTAGEYDYRVIPDKYNTGCSGSLTKINSACTVDGVEYRMGDDGNTVVIDLYYGRNKEEMADEVVIRNKDFSDKKFAIRHADMIDTQKSIRFENCVFKNVILDYKQDTTSYYFVDCSIENFSGSNATLERCLLGGSSFDGVNPFQNIVVKECYFAGFPQENVDGMHTDAMQVYGKEDVIAENIVFSNCRIEIPILERDDSRRGGINACFMVQLEYSDARNFLFEDCIINGGGYSIYAWDKNKGWELDNVVFRNISVGKGRLFGDIYPHKADSVVFDNVHSTEQLYVASVWKDSLGKIHLSVTNDTAEDRTLLVVTENGKQEFTIPCKATSVAAGAKEYYDLAIDMEIIPADTGSSWVVCYDGEERAENQIRFVNWGYNEVYREVK